jgi:hypothetical protein
MTHCDQEGLVESRAEHIPDLCRGVGAAAEHLEDEMERSK